MRQNDTTARIAHVFRGTFVHSTPRDAVEILESSVLGVDDEGKVCLFNFHLIFVSFWFSFEDIWLSWCMYTYISYYFFIIPLFSLLTDCIYWKRWTIGQSFKNMGVWNFRRKTARTIVSTFINTNCIYSIVYSNIHKSCISLIRVHTVIHTFRTTIQQ